jgi:hypothetical protein
MEIMTNVTSFQHGVTIAEINEQKLMLDEYVASSVIEISEELGFEIHEWMVRMTLNNS